MKIASLALVAFVTMASAVPALAEEATFLKQTSYKNKRVTHFNSGPHIFCQGRCSDDTAFEHRECRGSIVDTACALVFRRVPRACRNF